MRTLFRWLTVALLLALPCSSAAARPNIVFIFADDWGWGDLSCHGHPWLETPNVDRLAREGIDFQQFNVLSPVCSPSRAAVLTGQYPARFSIHQHFAEPALNHERGMPDWLDPNAPTLPKMLKAAGYRTAHFGKWHLSNSQTPGAPTPDQYGYDEWSVFNGGQGWPVADVHATAANTAAFIRAHKDHPFFVNAWLHESHLPHFPTSASMEKWKALDEQKQVYSAVITDGDDAVGAILHAIEEVGVQENTIVLFSSDNGPESTAEAASAKRAGDPAKIGYDGRYSIGQTGGLRGRKRSLFEGGVRVPFIVRWPGHAAAGRKDDRTVFSAVDLLPTLCAAAGAEVAAGYQGDGENLLGAFEGKTMTRTKPLFWQWLGKSAEPDWWPRLAVRDGEWKLVMTDDAKRVELHRLTEDREEAVDSAREYPEVVNRLSKLALDWKATLPEKPDPACLIKTAAPPAPNPVPPPPSATSKTITPEARAVAFKRWDVNKDGILGLDEYREGLKGQANLEARLKRFDKDGDGKVTREEFIGGPATRKATGAADPNRPNILFILTDDQGYGDVAKHGHPLLKTPNLDRLHDESVRFENFYVSPSCSPTRAALMTGMHEFRNGVTHTTSPREHLNLSAQILPQLLRKAGYRTGFIGKWHLGNEPGYAPRDRGFDWWATNVGGAGGHFDPDIIRNGHRSPSKGFREDLFFDEAMAFIEESGAQPFFCYLATFSPHVPLAAPEAFVQPFRDKVSAEQATYLGMVANIDFNVGRILTYLEQKHLDERTIVIFMNDNGATYGLDVYNAGMRGCKCTAWQGGSRAMSFWRWPNHWQAHAVLNLTAHLDVLPTLCDLAGAAIPADTSHRLDGFTLRPLLESSAPIPWHNDRLLFHHVGRWPSGLAASHKYAMAAVQSADFLLVRSEPCGDPQCEPFYSQCAALRLVRNGAVESMYTKQHAQFHWALTPPGRWSLYSVRQDPACELDLTSRLPDLAASMAAAYDQWWDGMFPQMISAGGDSGASVKLPPGAKPPQE